MAPRKIVIVVTARPSYSRIKTAMVAIEERDDLELQVVCLGPALLDRYGDVATTIESDGFNLVARVYSHVEGENPTSSVKSTGIAVAELASVFERLSPDAVVSIADRFETLATAIAASYMNIPLVHVQGGEKSGNIDEKVRHAATKLADLHFVATELARERVIKMGEDPERVFNTGCPSIDIAAEVLKENLPPIDPYEKYGGVGTFPDLSNGYALCIQHPVTTEYRKARGHVLETLNVLKALDVPSLWFWPNADSGSDGTAGGIRAFREQNPEAKLQIFKYVLPKDFIRMAIGTSCVIGNSSFGVREATYLGLPAVNLGNRQHGRDRGTNVIDAEHDSEAIAAAVKIQLNNGKYAMDSMYGDGNAGKIMAELLAERPLTSEKTLAF